MTKLLVTFLHTHTNCITVSVQYPLSSKRRRLILRGLLLPCTILINALATRITPRSNVIRAAAHVTVGLFLGISPGSFFKSSDIASSGEVIGSSTPSVSILESTKYMWKDVAQNMDRDKALALVYGTLSAFMTAVHAVLVKSAVKTLQGSVLRLTYWSNMMSGIFLVRHFSHFLLQDSMLIDHPITAPMHPSQWRSLHLHDGNRPCIIRYSWVQ